eukprot:187164-Rhodomonas_salina.1
MCIRDSPPSLSRQSPLSPVPSTHPQLQPPLGQLGSRVSGGGTRLRLGQDRPIRAYPEVQSAYSAERVGPGRYGLGSRV